MIIRSSCYFLPPGHPLAAVVLLVAWVVARVVVVLGREVVIAVKVSASERDDGLRPAHGRCWLVGVEVRAAEQEDDGERGESIHGCLRGWVGVTLGAV